LKSFQLKIIPFLGYVVSILFIFFSLFLLSNNLSLQNKLESAQLEYENLLSEKLQLERSFYRLKEELLMERKTANPVIFSQPLSLTDSLHQVILLRDQELEKLSKKIVALEKQIRNK